MSAEILRELARAKVIFQLRAIETIIHGTAQAIEARSGETQSGSTEGESAVRKDAPKGGTP